MADGKDRQEREERAREIALFRYMLIRDAADPALSSRERGALIRRIAAVEHAGPDGRPVRVTRWTLDRWARMWRAGGFDALVPTPRQAAPRTPTEVLDLAAALRRENPQRTAAHIRRIVAAQLGWAPDERTLQRYFTRTGLGPRQLAAADRPAGVFSPFEASRSNELWTGDTLHGPRVGGEKTYLFAFVDDYSRTVVGYRWGRGDDSVRLAAALRPALAARGVPDRLYTDNGSSFVDAALLRACAKLGIRLTHSTPGRPEGRGKVERFFRTVRDQFLVEIAGTGDADSPGRLLGGLDELNRLFQGWVEHVYHRREHTETGQPPLARWEAGGPVSLPTPAELTEAFRWSVHRTVRRTGLVALHNNRYQVDAALAGNRVELVFDPFDLTTLSVRLGGVEVDTATPFEITRHSHPKTRATTPTDPPRPTGIDYLALVDAEHTATLTQKINYAALVDTPTGQTTDGKDTP